MGDGLAQKLYEQLIASMPRDLVVGVPRWERLHRNDQASWESIAVVARKNVQEQCAAQLRRTLENVEYDEAMASALKLTDLWSRTS
jgi:hypothetical protein